MSLKPIFTADRCDRFNVFNLITKKNIFVACFRLIIGCGICFWYWFCFINDPLISSRFIKIDVFS